MEGLKSGASCVLDTADVSAAVETIRFGLDKVVDLRKAGCHVVDDEVDAAKSVVDFALSFLHIADDAVEVDAASDD